MSKYGAFVKWYWQWTREVPGEKPSPLPLGLPQIPHRLIWDQIRASAVRNQRLTYHAMPDYLYYFYLVWYICTYVLFLWLRFTVNLSSATGWLVQCLPGALCSSKCVGMNVRVLLVLVCAWCRPWSISYSVRHTDEVEPRTAGTTGGLNKVHTLSGCCVISIVTLRHSVRRKWKMFWEEPLRTPNV